MKKELWNSKRTFILAAVGSAAWLGNLIRFPFQVYENGGAAFLIPYFVILLIIGLPLLMAEITLGQKKSAVAPNATGKVHPVLKMLGWLMVFSTFVIISYYSVIIGWLVNYTSFSLSGFLSGTFLWGSDTTSYFYNDFLQLSDGLANKGNLVHWAFYGTLAVFIALFFALRKWVHSVGKAMTIFAITPFFTLLILLLFSLSLPGAGQWLEFLVQVDISKLMKLDTWLAAAGQIFFTLSLAMWVMISYGALKPKTEEIVKTTGLVVIWNTVISFLGALTIFATLGHMAQVSGKDFWEVVKGGPGLFFEAFPAFFNTLPAEFLIVSVIFFLTVLFLAFTSIISMCDSVILAIQNNCKKVSRTTLTIIVLLIGFAASTLYMYQNGLYVLDVVDHYLTTFLIILFGILELVLFLAISKKMSAFMTERSDLPKFFTSVIMLRIFWFISFVVLSYLMYLNITWGFWVYDSYSADDMKPYVLGLFGFVWIAALAMSIWTSVYKISEENSN